MPKLSSKNFTIHPFFLIFRKSTKIQKVIGSLKVLKGKIFNPDCNNIDNHKIISRWLPIIEHQIHAGAEIYTLL